MPETADEQQGIRLPAVCRAFVSAYIDGCPDVAINAALEPTHERPKILRVVLAADLHAFNPFQQHRFVQPRSRFNLKRPVSSVQPCRPPPLRQPARSGSPSDDVPGMDTLRHLRSDPVRFSRGARIR